MERVFKSLRLLLQDHAVEVRRDFLAKVRGRLVDKKLPTKWAVVLSLATVDDDRDIASDVSDGYCSRF